MATPAGMVFTIDARGNPIPQYFPDTGAVPSTGLSAEGNAEAMMPGDWQLVVTGVPAGTAPSTIAALILSSPVALPLPWKGLHWQVAYGSLGSAVTATAF
jgi:hypothetical protein